MEPKPRYWMSRLLLASWLLSLGLTTAYDATVTSTQALHEAGFFGFLAPQMLVFLAVCAMLDAIVNDMMPRRFVLSIVRWRHVLYPITGMLLTIITAMVASKAGVRPLLANYLLPCLWCFVLTFMQIFAKPREVAST